MTRRKSKNNNYDDYDEEEDSDDFYVVSAEEEHASAASRNPPIMPLQRRAESSSMGQRVPQSKTQQVRSFHNTANVPSKLQAGSAGKRSLEVTRETVAPPDVKKKPEESQTRLDQLDSRFYDNSELLEHDFGESDTSMDIPTDQMAFLALRENVAAIRQVSLDKLKELVAQLAISLEQQTRPIEPIVKDIVSETQYLVGYSSLPLKYDLDIFARLSVVRCSDEALINAIASLFHGGVPQEFIRDCCKDLRRAQRFDIIILVARTVISALRTNSSGNESSGLLSLANLRDLLEKDALPLEIELGLAVAEFQQDIAMKYDLFSDDTLLDSIKRRVSLVPANVQGREFPWFVGQFTLVEPLPGEKDMRWNLRIKATERVVARRVRINFGGTSSWTGNMMVSKSDLTNEVGELNGTMNLVDIAGTTKKMDVTMVDGWMSGSISGRSTNSNLLAKPLNGTKTSPVEGMRTLMLQDGLYLDTGVTHHFGERFSIDFFFLLPSKLHRNESKLMTIFSNGIVSFGIKPISSSSMNELGFQLENKHDLRQVISQGRVSFQHDKWIHVCISSDFDQTAIYIQGRRVSDTPSRKPSQDSIQQQTLLVGADVEKSSPNYFEGSLCEFRIWSRSLNEVEVNAILDGTPTDQDLHLNLYYPLTSSEDGLGFLQNVRMPSMPLIARPSLNKSAISLSSLLPVPPLVIKQRIGESTIQCHRVRSATSNVVWLESGFPSVTEGFECRVGLLLHTPSSSQSLQRMQLRIQSMFQLEMKEYPRLPVELENGVLNLPALHLSLVRNAQINGHSFTLEYASRLNDGTIHNQTKVFSLVLPGAGERQFVEFQLKSNGQKVMLSANNQPVCELPITMETSTEAPFYVGCHVEPQLEIASFHFDVASAHPGSFALNSAITTKENDANVGQRCSSCGETLPENGISKCDECLTRGGEWSCKVCTTINPNNAMECMSCGELLRHVKPYAESGTKSTSIASSAASAKSAWGPPTTLAQVPQTPNACPACTFVNPPSEVVCQMCESPLKNPDMPPSISKLSSSSTVDIGRTGSSYAVAAQQQPLSQGRSVQGQSDQARRFREDEGIRRLKDSYLTAAGAASSNINVVEEDHLEYLFDSTQGLVRLLVSKQPQVIFKCEGELEDGKVVCDVTFDSTANQWTVEGQRVDGEFTFTLTLDGFGERIMSGSYQNALRNGRWTSGTYSSLASSLRGLSGSCFAVGLQNMVQGLSNICSQNAVIQALFACQQLRDLILTQDVSAAGSGSSDIVSALGKLFREMETTPFRCIGARALQSTLPAKYRQAEEMDATEFIADVFHAFESKLGPNTMRDLLSYPQTTQLQCSTCGETKTTNAEEPTTTILPLPKMFTPIIGMYLYVCKDGQDLPPTQLPLAAKMKDSVMTRIPINLVNEKRNVVTPLIYLCLERAPIKPAPPPRSPRSQNLSVQPEESVLPITHIEVGTAPYVDAEPIQVFNSQGQVENAFDSVFPLLPIFVRRVRFANPITDVQVLKGDLDTRLPSNFSRTGPLVNIPKSLFTYGLNDTMRPSSTSSEPPVVLSYTSNMPISDVFVGTAGDLERRGLRGYSQCPTAVGEAPDSGDQVFVWFTSADFGGRPPVTRLNIVPGTDVPDQEDENESVCGYIPLGFTSSVAVIQSKNGHGSPITSIDIMTAMNRSQFDHTNRSFHVVMDVSSIAKERIEDVYILTDTNVSQGDFHRSGLRFVRSDGAQDAVDLFEVNGEAIVDSYPHRFEGIVCSTLNDPTRLTLLGRFQDGQNHQLLASWSTTTFSWNSLPGSSLKFTDLGIPRIFEVVLDSRPFSFGGGNEQVHGGWYTVERAGVYLHGRTQPLHPDELPLTSLYVRELKVRSGQAQLADEEENQVQRPYEMVGSMLHTYGRSSYDAEEVEFQLFVMRATHPSQPFVSKIKLVPESQVHSYLGSEQGANAGKIGAVSLLFFTEDGGRDWSDTFASQDVTLKVQRRTPNPIRAKLTYLDFLRKPRHKIEGVSYRKLSDEEVFWGTGKIEQKSNNSLLVVVNGAFADSGMCVLRTSSGTSNGVRDEDIRIGIQKDTTEYWEDGQCVFSPRKSGNDIESMLSLAMNSEVLDAENMVECSSGKCRNQQDGSFLRRPHLSRKLPGKSPRLLAMHVDRIKFDLASQRPLKDLRKTPLQPTIRVGNEIYALFGIVVHVGPSAQSGHYYTYCREVKMGGMDGDLLLSDAKSSSWMLLNDATTERVSFQSIVDVLERGHGTETPYLMFYWRMEASQHPNHPQGRRSDVIVQRLIEEKKVKERELLERNSASRTYLDARKVYLFGD